MNTPQPDAPSGVLLVDKDPGFTSHNVVALCRRILATRKVGHCGTLDPMATGMLMIVVGKATRLQDFLMSEDKVYSATMQLGIETNSQDADGEVVASKPTTGISEDDILRAFESFHTEFDQIPPMYSAVKINGVPCYKLARRGQEVARKSRRVRVLDYSVTHIDLPAARVDFIVHCSKGFYVRTYAHDIGQRLGCGAHLTALRRIRSGSFDVSQAISVPELKASTRSQVLERLIPIDHILNTPQS